MSDTRPGRDPELTALYALDALSDAERAEVEASLRRDPEELNELARWRPAVEGLLTAVPQVDPPIGLRARVLAATMGRPAGAVHIHDRRTPVWPAWAAAAASLVVAAGLAYYTAGLRARFDALEAQLAAATSRLAATEQQVASAQLALAQARGETAVLTAPDLAQASLRGLEPAPNARGRAFWSRSRGLVMTGSELPALPPGRVYQLWILTSGQPISAGLLSLDPNGQVSNLFTTPPDLPAPVGVAVTIEPEGGVPQPTGAIYLHGNMAAGI